MIKKDKKNGKLKKFLYGKSFYAVLAICVFAVGVACFAAIENISIPITDSKSSTSEASDPGEQVGIAISNIPKETEPDEQSNIPEPETSAEPVTEENTQANEVPSGDEDAPVSANPYATSVKPYEGNYMLPLSSDIIKEFSDKELVYSKTMRDYRAHSGVDFAADKSAKVAAVNDGTVKSVYTDPLWGGVIEIEHSESMISRYCGITPSSGIEEGMSVQLGQFIGTVTTIPLESADELHLHFEVLIDEKAVDPLKAINKAS